jgi:hypothetical protein
MERGALVALGEPQPRLVRIDAPVDGDEGAARQFAPRHCWPFGMIADLFT